MCIGEGEINTAGVEAKDEQESHEEMNWLHLHHWGVHILEVFPLNLHALMCT